MSVNWLLSPPISWWRLHLEHSLVPLLQHWPIQWKYWRYDHVKCSLISWTYLSFSCSFRYDYKWMQHQAKDHYRNSKELLMKREWQLFGRALGLPWPELLHWLPLSLQLMMNPSRSIATHTIFTLILTKNFCGLWCFGLLYDSVWNVFRNWTCELMQALMRWTPLEEGFYLHLAYATFPYSTNMLHTSWSIMKFPDIKLPLCEIMTKDQVHRFMPLCNMRSSSYWIVKMDFLGIQISKQMGVKCEL